MMVTLNTIGVISAITTLLTIWFGHVMVRNLEVKLTRIVPAMFVCILLGFIFIFGALLSNQNWLSASSGILGITFLWDALEFKRQEKRVKVGHAPANLANPRHLMILAQYPTATTFDLLDREPRGNR